MEWWGVYLHGDRKQRYLSYISESAAKRYAKTLNSRNKNIRFVAMDVWLLADERYEGERIY